MARSIQRGPRMTREVAHGRTDSRPDRSGPKRCHGKPVIAGTRVPWFGRFSVCLPPVTARSASRKPMESRRVTCGPRSRSPINWWATGTTCPRGDEPCISWSMLACLGISRHCWSMTTLHLTFETSAWAVRA